MDPVIVKNVAIGAGMPKICVPLVANTREEVLEQAASLRDLPADLAEWRFDHFYEVSSLSLLTVLTFLSELRQTLGDTPLIFTFRTAQEGGQKQLSLQSYIELYHTVITSGLVDLVDIELSLGDAPVARLLETARAKDVKVILSNHDFEGTPSKEELIARLQRMQDMGADIAKIAVMPQEPEDVLTLLSATKAFSDTADIPIITMAMGGLGTLSRVAGEMFGSAVTFGSAGKESAPGQLPLDLLKGALEHIHETL